MYRNILLTLLVLLAAAIVVELLPSRRPDAPVPVEDDHSMATRVPEFTVHAMPLPQAVELLSKKTGVSIRVDWAALKEYRTLPITTDLSDQRLDDVLAALFDSARNSPIGTRDWVDFDVVDGAVLVTSMHNLPPNGMTWRLYDVRDLVTDEYWGYSGRAGDLLASKWRQTFTYSGSMGGTPPNPADSDVRDARLLDLALFIRHGSTMQNWDAGGKFGALIPGGHALVQPFGGRIAVLQTHYGHRKVTSVLARLRGPAHVPSERR